MKHLVPFSWIRRYVPERRILSEIEINDYATVVYYHEETKTILPIPATEKIKEPLTAALGHLFTSDPLRPVVLNSHDQNAEDGDIYHNGSGSSICFLSMAIDAWVTSGHVWEKSGTEENPTYTVVDVVGDE
ncbi:MAG: hypothetical protein ACLU8D_09050 [Enterocloster sp.]